MPPIEQAAGRNSDDIAAKPGFAAATCSAFFDIYAAAGIALASLRR